MNKKYIEPKPSKSIVFIGDNFINTHIHENFKRYSNIKSSIYKNIKQITHLYDIIIDCSFNQKSQDECVKYAIDNKISKILIVNHWKRDIKNIENLVIIQIIVPDVYGVEHMSFYRQGTGNNYDFEINFCTLICESIRKIHESKYDLLPLTYIYYGQDKVKYIYVENLYEPINYIVNSINSNCYFEIYDEEKNVNEILSIIKDVIDYNGRIIFENTENIYNKSVKKLDYRHSYKPFKNMVKIIYQYLLCENERFRIS